MTIRHGRSESPRPWGSVSLAGDMGRIVAVYPETLAFLDASGARGRLDFRLSTALVLQALWRLHRRAELMGVGPGARMSMSGVRLHVGPRYLSRMSGPAVPLDYAGHRRNPALGHEVPGRLSMQTCRAALAELRRIGAVVDAGGGELALSSACATRLASAEPSDMPWIAYAVLHARMPFVDAALLSSRHMAACAMARAIGLPARLEARTWVAWDERLFLPGDMSSRTLRDATARLAVGGWLERGSGRHAGELCLSHVATRLLDESVAELSASDVHGRAHSLAVPTPALRRMVDAAADLMRRGRLASGMPVDAELTLARGVDMSVGMLADARSSWYLPAGGYDALVQALLPCAAMCAGEASRMLSKLSLDGLASLRPFVSDDGMFLAHAVPEGRFRAPRLSGDDLARCAADAVADAASAGLKGWTPDAFLHSVVQRMLSAMRTGPRWGVGPSRMWLAHRLYRSLFEGLLDADGPGGLVLAQARRRRSSGRPEDRVTRCKAKARARAARLKEIEREQS